MLENSNKKIELHKIIFLIFKFTLKLFTNNFTKKMLLINFTF